MSAEKQSPAQAAPGAVTEAIDAFARACTEVAIMGSQGSEVNRSAALKRQAQARAALEAAAMWTASSPQKAATDFSELMLAGTLAQSGETVSVSFQTSAEASTLLDILEAASLPSTPAPRVPSREEIAHAIVLEIQFKDFGNTDPSGEEWVCTGEQINLLREAGERAADAVLALFSAPAQAARGTVTDEQLDKAWNMLAGTAYGRSDLRAALEAASLPSRPEPAAPVVPEELRGLFAAEKAAIEVFRAARDAPPPYSTAYLKQERDALDIARRKFGPAAIEWVRALLARQPAKDDLQEPDSR